MNISSFFVKVYLWMNVFLWCKFSEIASHIITLCLLCCWSLLCVEGWLESLPSSPLAAPPLLTKCFISLCWGWSTVLLLINDGAIPAQFITIHFTMQYNPARSPCAEVLTLCHDTWHYNSENYKNLFVWHLRQIH